MLRPRIIPSLLIHNKGLVKTVKFKDHKYVGDPLNAVKIFNEKEVDELCIFDIDASALGKVPDFDTIKTIAKECRMPLCYGGGVKTIEDAKKIVNLGAEKVAISSEAIKKPSLISQIADAIGVQSVVVVLDVKKVGIFGKYEVFTHNGKQSTGKSPIDLAKEFEKLGAGEIVLNNIDLDGVMKGYDTKLTRLAREAVNIPLTMLGGAGSFEDIRNLIDEFGTIGAAAGSLFVFKGKYKAVLINYPTTEEKKNIIKYN